MGKGRRCGKARVKRRCLSAGALSLGGKRAVGWCSFRSGCGCSMRQSERVEVRRQGAQDSRAPAVIPNSCLENSPSMWTWRSFSSAPIYRRTKRRRSQELGDVCLTRSGEQECRSLNSITPSPKRSAAFLSRPGHEPVTATRHPLAGIPTGNGGHWVSSWV